MAASCQSVSETLAGVIARRPVLEPVLKAFEPILEVRASLPETLGPLVREAGLRLPKMERERAAQGVSLLSDVPLKGVEIPMRAAAEALLPLLAEQGAVRPYAEKLAAFFAGESSGQEKTSDAAEQPARPGAVAEGLLRGDTSTLETCAETLGLPPAVLLFVFDFILGSVLRAVVETSLSGEGGAAEAPWDAEGVWMQGYCPVCGTFPSLAYLDRPVHDEKNAFLAGGGGKKHLHCALCGTDWKFRRGACPACGKEGDGVMEFLREPEGALGERIDWCTKCKSYCPSVDLRERSAVPDPDAMALGLMHLDMIAAGRKLRPLHPSFWNTF